LFKVTPTIVTCQCVEFAFAGPMLIVIQPSKSGRKQAQGFSLEAASGRIRRRWGDDELTVPVGLSAMET